MKKIILITLLLTILLILISCINNHAILKKRGQLVDISVFDIDGNEISGEFIDEYCIYSGDCNLELKTVQLSTLPLNSAAPIDLFYVVDVSAGEDYIIQFKIKRRRDLLVKHLTLGQVTYAYSDFYENEYDDDYQYVSIYFSSLSDDENYIHLSSFSMYRIDAEDSTELKGTTWQESRTFIEGVYFNFIED